MVAGEVEEKNKTGKKRWAISIKNIANNPKETNKRRKPHNQAHDSTQRVQYAKLYVQKSINII